MGGRNLVTVLNLILDARTREWGRSAFSLSGFESLGRCTAVVHLKCIYLMIR
jgi:hypothetical protein